MSNKTSAKPKLTLHSLIGSLSFWGTSVRTLLFVFLSGMALILGISELDSGAGIDQEVMVFVYALCCFLLLDVGYVIIAKAYALQDGLDMLALGTAATLITLIYVLPKIVVTTAVHTANDYLIYLVFIPLVVLSGRMLLGMLFGARAR